MKYWIYIDGYLYIKKSINLISFINNFLKCHHLQLTDLDELIAFGYIYDDNAFILFNNAEINELKDWLSNFFKKIYIMVGV